MTDDNTIRELLTGDPTRRSVLKSGALAGAGAVLGASGTAAAQQDGGDGVVGDQEWQKAIMPVSQFEPRSRFIITSPVLQWQPRIEEIEDNVWSEYNTRAIRYLNSNEQILFWMAQDASVPDFDQEAGYVVDDEGDTFQNGNPQPEVFRMRSEFSVFGDSGYVTVQFTPVGEDEEESLFQDDEDGGIFFEEDQQESEPAGLDDIPDFGGGNQTGGNVTDGNVTGENQTGGNDSGVL